MRTNCRFSNQLLRSIADSGIIMQRSGLFSHTRARNHSSILRILSSSILCICADRKIFLEIVNFFIRMTCLVEAIKPYVILPARVLSPLPAPVRHQWFVTIYWVTTWRWECKVQRDRGRGTSTETQLTPGHITHTGTLGLCHCELGNLDHMEIVSCESLVIVQVTLNYVRCGLIHVTVKMDGEISANSFLILHTRQHSWKLWFIQGLFTNNTYTNIGNESTYRYFQLIFFCLGFKHLYHWVSYLWTHPCL